MLTPFSVKDGMTLAVPSRLPLQDTSTFDSLLEDQDSTAVNYLQSCRSRFGENNGTTRSETATLSMDIDAESCQAWDGIRKERMPMFKLLQFCENHRPAYYGSWTKQRGCINPRNPFKMDSVSESEEWCSGVDLAWLKEGCWRMYCSVKPLAVIKCVNMMCSVCSTTVWIVMRSGRRKNPERASLIVKLVIPFTYLFRHVIN